MTDTDSYKTFFEHIDLSKYKSILCLNGDLPDASFFNEINLPVIAADGGANYLIKNKIPFDLVIGDLDSLDISKLLNIRTIHEPNQSFSDFEKSIKYLKSNDLLPAIILGINGGYIDHILYNIKIFQETDSIFFAPPILGYIVRGGQTQMLELLPNTKISLMGAPEALITTEGFKWDLKDDVLSFFGVNSCFNRIIARQSSIQVIKGNLLVLIYGTAC